MLRPLKGIFPPTTYPSLLVGLETPDDAAVYMISDSQAIISTMDFFPPVVDDPYDFGAIAAANALSDVYAMGGEPLMAINLAAYPDGLGMDILTKILRGGAEKAMEAGCVIAGGHTVTDKEPKYGLSVTGQIHPEQIVTKAGARPGDALILTKPLGTGVVTTALKQQIADNDHLQVAVDTMKRLNRDASRIAVEHGVHAMTDITGYGLLGHGHEIAHSSSVNFELEFSAIQWLPGVMAYHTEDAIPGGTYRNKQYYDQWVQYDEEISESWRLLLNDPQTSGGLLMALPPEAADQALSALLEAGDNAAIIGSVRHGDGHIHIRA